jgi:mutual gliding-motility protein MglA
MADQLADENKLVIKIVYYGPALSGKTTNIIGLHDLMDSSSCGDLMSFETKGDRTLFFDLLPLLVKAENSNLRIKIKLYTVPGQVAHDATRKAVLSRADGVVFVADSLKNQAVSNFESFDNLEKNAARVGLDLDRLPLVIQFNKRDLADIVSHKEVIERWKPTGLPLFFSSALKRQGISETFEQVLIEVYRRLDQELGLSTIHKVQEKDFLSVVPNRVN